MNVIKFLGMVSLYACFCVSSAFAAVGDKEKASLSEILKKADYSFTPAVRAAYIAYGEAVIKDKYGPKKINDATWKWIHQRPAIMSAVMAATYPVNPNILLNFQRMCLPLGSVKAAAWVQLSLAYAIAHRDELFPIDRVKEEWNPGRLERELTQPRGKGGDFIFQSDDDLPPATDEEKNIGDWLYGPQSLTLTRPKRTIPDFMKLALHEINIMVRKKPDDPPMLTKFPNWMNVALWGHLFPQYFDCTPTPQRAMAMKIYRNGKIPMKTNRPNFNMARSDWPILLYLADVDQVDETAFVFNYFVTHKEMARVSQGKKESSDGGAKLKPTDPNFVYAGSNWHPDKFIRKFNGLADDQGGHAFAWSLHALNVPATSVAAPPGGMFYIMGERGNYTYFMSCADNTFTGTGSSGPWLLPKAETVDPTRPQTGGASKLSGTRGGYPWPWGAGGVPHLTFFGLTHTLNQGLQEYEDARMALHLIEFLQLSKMQRIQILESVFMQNPMNGDVAYRLAAEYRANGDAKSTLKMLAAIRSYAAVGLKLPVSPSSAKSARNNVIKIMKAEEPSFQGLPTISVNSSPWLFLLCSDIAVRYLRDCGTSAKGLFKMELNYEKEAAKGCKDAPIERAIEALGELVR